MEDQLADRLARDDAGAEFEPFRRRANDLLDEAPAEDDPLRSEHADGADVGTTFGTERQLNEVGARFERPERAEKWVILEGRFAPSQFGAVVSGSFNLQADEFRALRFAPLVEPIGGDESRQVVFPPFDDRLQQQFPIGIGVGVFHTAAPVDYF